MATMSGGAFRISKGDHWICYPETWNVDRPMVEPSHKLYLPVSGEGEVWLGDQQVVVKPGQFYYFPAYRPIQYGCQAPFELFWMHVDVLDLELDLRLSRGPGACSWPVEQVPFLVEPFQDVQNRGKNMNASRATRMEAVALWLLSKVVERGEGMEVNPEREELMQRLRPAMVYMNKHYLVTPPLKEIATRVSISPEHFHRLFHGLLGVTPFQYMLRRRMADALERIRATTDPIGEIAEACGYDNPFYFSRVFHDFYGQSPTEARAVSRRSGK